MPYELEKEWTREGTSMVVEARFVEGLRGARVVEVGYPGRSSTCESKLSGWKS